MIKRWITGMILIASIGGVVFATAAPATVSAEPDEKPCAPRFLGLPTWYRGLTVSDTNCEIQSPDKVGGLSNFIWRIALNVVEMGLWIVGYIAAFFILYGGFQLFMSEGIVDKRVKAQKTMINALIGLVLSIVSIGLVNFVVSGLGI